MREKLIEHRRYVNTYGDDMPEVKNWKWKATPPRIEKSSNQEQE